MEGPAPILVCYKNKTLLQIVHVVGPCVGTEYPAVPAQLTIACFVARDEKLSLDSDRSLMNGSFKDSERRDATKTMTTTTTMEW